MSLTWSGLVSLACLALKTLAQKNVYRSDDAYMSGADGPSPVQNFTSRPDLTPPAINIRTSEATWAENEYAFIPYRYTEGRSALYILDGNGSLVWSSDNFPSMDLKVQTFQDQPVLTYFTGTFNAEGFGQGSYNIMNSSYSVLRNVTFQTDLGPQESDFHEFRITDNDTFLVPSWVPTQVDLSAKGGSHDGWTWDCQFQELDTDNNVLFNWSSLDAGVDVAQSYFGIAAGAGQNSTDAYDYCHLNSLEKDDDGTYLVSMRGTSALYKISASGDIIWQLGGKQTSFELQDADRFYYQHDARWLNDTTVNPRYLSVFDNNGDASGPAISPPLARGMVWRIDEQAMTAEVALEMPATSGTYSQSQGNVQKLDDDAGYFIGWGSQHWYTQYNTSGNVVYDVSFAPNVTDGPQAYRVFKQIWHGSPETTPDLGFANNLLYVSWNGATNVTSWALTAGDAADSLQLTNTTFARMGFESNTTYDNTSTYIAAVGLNADEDCLGVSDLYYAVNGTNSNIAVSCSQAGY